MLVEISGKDGQMDKSVNTLSVMKSWPRMIRVKPPFTFDSNFPEEKQGFYLNLTPDGEMGTLRVCLSVFINSWFVSIGESLLILLFGSIGQRAVHVQCAAGF